MASILSCKRLVFSPSKPAAIIPVLLGPAIFPHNLAAQGLPVETATPVPLALWVVGTVLLGLALGYGIIRSKARTRSEKQITEQGTKKLYAEEERDSA